MSTLNEQQLAFLWGYALERGHLKLGPYHEMADKHGADRVKTMRLALLAMKEMPDEVVRVELDALRLPPSWPFEDLCVLLKGMAHEKAERK